MSQDDKKPPKDTTKPKTVTEKPDSQPQKPSTVEYVIKMKKTVGDKRKKKK